VTKKKTKSRHFSELIEKGFAEKVGYQSGGRHKKMPRLELMVLQKILGATQGNPGCIKFIMKHLKMRPPKAIQSEIDHEIRYACGHREIYFRDGRREVAYSDGRIEIVWPDHSRQINHLDGRIEAIDENGSTTWTSEAEMEALDWPKTIEALKLARGY
jgi:hypothetical protein